MGEQEAVEHRQEHPRLELGVGDPKRGEDSPELRVPRLGPVPTERAQRGVAARLLKQRVLRHRAPAVILELRQQQRRQLVHKAAAREARTTQAGEAVVKGLDLAAHEVLERLLEHRLARIEPVGGGAERHPGRLGHRPVAHRVDPVLGDEAERGLEEQLPAVGSAGPAPMPGSPRGPRSLGSRSRRSVHLYCTIVHQVAAARKEVSDCDLLVIGGGIVGAAAALDASRRGLRVDLLERGPLLPAAGSSKGTARIFAPAAFPDAEHLEMGLRALELWRGIEGASGIRLLEPTGALSVGAFAERELGALEAAGEEAELIPSERANRDLGVHLGDERPILWQPRAGVILADRAHRALLGLARAAGARLRERERALALSEEDDAVLVETERCHRRCGAAVVAAGPWTAELLAGAGIEVPLRVSRQSVAQLRLADPGGRRPVALMEFDDEEPYALWEPAYGLKAAFHARGPEVDAGDEPGEPDGEAIARLEAWARVRFPAATAGLAGAETCLYTNAPGERFWLERRGRIAVVSACNGQGFQYAPETGRRAVELALEPLGLAAR